MAGRPRTYDEKPSYSYRVFYFPQADKYKILYSEFENICLNFKSKFFYHTNKKSNRGAIIRRLIMNFVKENTKKEFIREIADELIEKENKMRVDRYHKNNPDV